MPSLIYVGTFALEDSTSLIIEYFFLYVDIKGDCFVTSGPFRWLTTHLRLLLSQRDKVFDNFEGFASSLALATQHGQLFVLISELGLNRLPLISDLLLKVGNLVCKIGTFTTD